MAIGVKHAPRAGHPWTREGEWDLLDVRADTAEELQQVIAKAFEKFWQPWIRGVETLPDDGHAETGRYAAVLYKPSGAMRPWLDIPSDGAVTPQVVWMGDGDVRWQMSGPERQTSHPSGQQPTTGMTL